MGDGPRHDTTDPRRARSRALKILFQADLRDESPEQALRRVVEDPHEPAMLDDLDDLTDPAIAARAGATVDPTDRPLVASPALDGFTRQLVLGVSDHRDELDELIGRYARRWSVGRMPAVDRSVLRLATYELRYEHTSPAVVINEALELAKDLSTDASSRYVNGVLESIRKHLAQKQRPGA